MKHVSVGSGNKYGKNSRGGGNKRADNDGYNSQSRIIRKRIIKHIVKKHIDIKQYFFVIRELTASEIKRKYARSVLGILWSVLNPLLSMIVIALVFSTMFRGRIENYPVYILIGQTMWSLISNATKAPMTALVDNKNLLIKSKLPKQIFTMSRVYTAFVNFLYSLIALVAILLFFRIVPTKYTLLFPIPVLLCLIFSMGVSFILSTVYVFFGDIKHLYIVFLNMVYYLSAIFYPVDGLPGFMQRVVGNNPVYLFIHCARDCALNGVLSHWTVWVKMCIWAFGMLIIGIVVYKSKENDIMQRI